MVPILGVNAVEDLLEPGSVGILAGVLPVGVAPARMPALRQASPPHLRHYPPSQKRTPTWNLGAGRQNRYDP
jgi:hypothetical protein